MNLPSVNRTSWLGLVVASGIVWVTCPVPGAEFFVDTRGDDTRRGTPEEPLRTIQRAADLAQPGDVITVRAGTYRERVNPPRGGDSDQHRITYQAAKGETVEILGSEVVNQWVKVADDVWSVTLPNTFFGSFNPYNDRIRGDWFEGKGREHHTGAVYVDGEWLSEAARKEDVLAPGGDASAPKAKLWFAAVDATNTTIWARFPGVNPTDRRVEINVRQTVFYPDQPGRNYLTVRGFTMRHAATPWAPPTAEQKGLIGTHWSKGWIIEDNVISHSICSGIALGKHGDRWDNTSATSAEGYVKTIERALERGWNRDTIGHHVVRNNTISHCEQAGIVGSLGAAFSTVTGNVIHDIHVRRLFTGAEMAGIKFHAAIDSVIQGNHIHHTCLGLWLDWMAQGTRVSGNLFHDNSGQDLFVEVNHGPFVVDNNLFLSPVSLLDMSEGGAYAHNLFAGKIISRPEPSRETPFHPAHSTTVAGLVTIRGGDNRFMNNIFVGRGEGAGVRDGRGPKDPEWQGGYGLWVYDFRELPTVMSGNIYFRAARPGAKEPGAVVVPKGPDPFGLDVSADGVKLRADWGDRLQEAKTVPVTTSLLGKAKIPGVGYENADGSPLTIDRDFFGNKRPSRVPGPGPFGAEQSGLKEIKLR